MTKERRGVIATALAWIKGTGKEPGAYEQWLLEEYACARLSIDEVIRLLDESVERADAEQIIARSTNEVGFDRQRE
jgi:hypothetical protein